MTNPDDYWRHRQGAAPHAPPHSKPLPGPTNPPPSLGGGTADSYPTGTGSAAGAPFGFLFVAFIFSPIIGTVLYPLSATTALVAAFATQRVLTASAPNLSADGRLPIAMLASMIVFWPLCRLDTRLAATFTPYRLTRHIARVGIIASFVTLTSLNPGNGFPRSIEQVRAIVLGHPAFYIGFAVVAVLAHLFLMRSKSIRMLWHALLDLFHLRPSSVR